MLNEFRGHLDQELKTLHKEGLYKHERELRSPQGSAIKVAQGDVLNFCANNYLGLADDADLIAAARESLGEDGFGMASVRFICGTNSMHHKLEKRLAEFLGMDEAILYSSCFDANAGLFETLLGPEDAVISDALNHASIIDGVRLCKAKRYRYANNDMADLEAQLEAADAAGARFKLIATDGVFSMDGVIADLPGICDLADRYGAMVMVDDSHASGFMGANGRGTHEYHNVVERVDIVTTTFGKALGGASGGVTAARGPIVDWLRQRSRPYLFSNSLAPAIVGATLTAIDKVEQGHALRERLWKQRRAVPRADGGGRVRAGRGRSCHHSGDARRGAARRGVRRPAAGGGHLRDRLLLSGGPAGQGAHPHADQRRAHDRTDRCRGRRLRAGRSRARGHRRLTMKALSKLEAGKGIWQTSVEVPKVGPNDVLIRIRRSSICGTDIHIYNWDAWAASTIPVPMVVGHEYAGEIVEVGSEVRGLKVGDRVSGEGHITCGHCRNCRAGRRHLCRNTVGVGVNRQGSFAEYLCLPAFNVFKLPDDISDDLASIFDPLGNAVHTALSFDVIGEDVLITGAGPIGIMAAAIVRHVGARHVVVTDINDYRLDLAATMGATRTVNVAKQKLEEVMAEIGMVEGFDVVLEMSGAKAAIYSMLEVINNGGKIAMLGIPPAAMPLDWNPIIFKGLTIKGIYGREMFETWYKMASLIQSGLDVSPVITHRFGIDDFQQGFDIMNSGQSGKVILNWD